MNAMKNRPEPLHLRDTARCASRGLMATLDTGGEVEKEQLDLIQ
jgi:hypothetical protein